MDESEKNRNLTRFFGQYISENRKALIEKALDNRTRYVTLVMEDIYQSQNASAAVRTCECMGIQEVHFVENSTHYSTNKKVLKGSDKWIDIIRHNEKNVNNTEQSFRVLREAGYKIYAMDPSPLMVFQSMRLIMPMVE
jgi:tRNA (guanosine-2'-O-)-methyltransferase